MVKSPLTNVLLVSNAVAFRTAVICVGEAQISGRFEFGHKKHSLNGIPPSKSESAVLILFFFRGYRNTAIEGRSINHRANSSIYQLL